MAGRGMIGTKSNRMDGKGRVAVPAKWRDQLGDEIVVTPGAENCLYVYSSDKFDAMLETIENAPVMSDRDVRQTLRKLLGDSEEMKLDKQGRILLTNEHRRYADLMDEQDVLFKGVGDHLEIWKPEKWEEYDKDFSLAEGSKAFAPMGL